MIKKIMLIALPLLCCLSIACHLLYYFGIAVEQALTAYSICFGAFQLGGALWIYSSSTLRKSHLRNLIYLCIAAFWIGQVFIIQHWPGGRITFLVGAGGILVGYGIHFLKKSGKMYLDWLKLTWVVLFLSLMTIAIIYDKSIRHWIGWAFNINSVMLIGLYYFKALKKEEYGRFELSDDETAVFDYKKP